MEGQAIQVAGGVPRELPAPWASLRGRLGLLWTLLVGQIVDDDILGASEPAAGLHAPTLITYSDRSKVIITGDLTRDELVKVAESMRVYGDVDKPLMPGFGQ